MMILYLKYELRLHVEYLQALRTYLDVSNYSVEYKFLTFQVNL